MKGAPAGSSIPRGERRWSMGQLGALACLLEATAPKPGNVHRGADFEDLSYLDLIAGGVAIGPALDRASAGQRLGATVLDAVRATQAIVRTNTNLGTVLLLAPLAMIPPRTSLVDGIGEILGSLNADDARDVYEAIRTARPGGLGTVAEADVAGPAPADLLEAMRLAAPRDLVAAQYAGDFRDVFEFVVPRLGEALEAGCVLGDAIVHVHLFVMSRFPDSLIARKCGPAVARQASDRAADVLRRGSPGDAAYSQGLADLDFWLRSDHHRRNPGTTADMIAAGLFVALREAKIPFPLGFYGGRHE